MGIGAICHTINPRLFPEQIVYIVNHAEDRMIFVDLTFVPLLEKIAKQIDGVETFVILTDKAHMPQTTPAQRDRYEDLIGDVDDDFKWVKFDENTAAGLCYTSGTTGNPKGVLYSHRSNVLHALAVNTADCIGAKSSDTLLPVVPMFHANAWAHDLRLPDGRRQAGDAGRKARRPSRLRTAGEREGHVHGGGADRVADAADPPGREQAEAAASCAR